MKLTNYKKDVTTDYIGLFIIFSEITSSLVLQNKFTKEQNNKITFNIYYGSKIKEFLWMTILYLINPFCCCVQMSLVY